MFRKSLEINPVSVYAETNNRVVNEQEEEFYKPKLPVFGTKFKNINSSRLEKQEYVERNPVQIGRKTGTFASEIEAKIAAKRLNDKIRIDAMKY